MQMNNIPESFHRSHIWHTGPNLSYTMGLQSVATVVNNVYIVKITQFWWLGISVTVIYTRAVCKPCHNNRCSPLP